ncbi:MAG: SurA N-terminal domain-containing protein [Pikeienuella sp.]
MLNLLRRGVKTWVAKALFGLLVISFAVWGIGDVFSFGLGSSVATVGDQKIPAERYAVALNREIRAISNRIGEPVDAETARSLGLPQQVLARLAQEATLDQAMAEFGVSAPDEAVSKAILADPSFRGAAGGFDQSAYRYALAQNGFDVESYEDAVRRSIARRELLLALSDGAVAPKGAVDALYAYQTETRRFALITLDESAAGEIAPPDEAALKTYYDAHKDEFAEPERRDATYLHLSVEALAGDYQPEEADLRALYERQSSNYLWPERRELFQIIYGDKAGAEAAAARIAAGTADFDALLAERNETRADAAMGEISRDEIAAATGDVAFGLSAPGVAGPVDTGFGWALIEVASIRPEEIIAFEEVKENLTAALRRDHALDRAPEIAGEVEDRRAGGETLEAIATALNLPLGTASGVAADGDGGEGFTLTPAFLTELFTAEQGEERDMAETPEGAYFVLRVDAIAPETILPQDQVRAEVEASWRRAATADALDEVAKALVARIDAGETLTAIAAEQGVPVVEEGPKTRVEGWSEPPADLVETLFAADMGGAGFARNGAGATIGTVAEIAPGADNPANNALRDGLAGQMNEMVGGDVISLFIAAKQRQTGVSVNQQAIDAMLVQASSF